MNSNYNASAAEEGVIKVARQLLGDNLAVFLLSGLGETEITHSRPFTAEGTNAHGGAATTYQFEMINESEQGLPMGRDPHVLVSLVDLLLERQPLDSRILFQDSHILEKLGWPQGSDSQAQIRQSLERYFLPAYCLIDPTVAEGRRLLGRYASLRRLLVGYETTSAMLPIRRTSQKGLIKVQFLPEFFYDALSDRKYFLGIEFQRLLKLQNRATA